MIGMRKPCYKKLAPGQWWGHCGDTDMGQTSPSATFCTECGGVFILDGVKNQEKLVEKLMIKIEKETSKA